MSDTDPGGGQSGGLPDLINLQENFSQQQAKITALKEFVRQSEAEHGKNTATAKEKVKNIAQRLNNLKSKATKSRQGGSLEKSQSESQVDHQQSNLSLCPTDDIDLNTSTELSFVKSRSETPGTEKIQLLRKKMEQNRQKMAEREHNQKGIEALVTQLKAKFNDTQQTLEKSSMLGRSIGDLSSLTSHHPPLVLPRSNKFQSSGDLSTSHQTTTLDKERIKYLEKRITDMESKPDTEPDVVKQLENRILDLEETIREKDSVIDARTQAVSLMSENLSLKGKTTVDMLEDTKQEMVKMQTNFVQVEEDLHQQLKRIQYELDDRNRKIDNLQEINDILETARYDLTLKNAELEKRIQDDDFTGLKQLNETLQRRIIELESHQSESDEKIKEIEGDNDQLRKSIQHSEIIPENNVETLREQIKLLEAQITDQQNELRVITDARNQLEENLMEKTIECNVLNANFSVLQEKLKATAPKSLFSTSTDEEAQAEITKLKTQLDESNKLTIKNKLKIKQLQKQIDSFKKTSDLGKEFVKQSEENVLLKQRVDELEQSHQPISDQPIEQFDFIEKIKLLETTCQNQTSAIQLLEEQKIDMTADLQTTKSELIHLKDHLKSVDEETNRVTDQMESIVLEERNEELHAQIADLQKTIDQLTVEKLNLIEKLDHYVAENIELLDRIEKMSKGSSAESIEIVERLTQQETFEMEEMERQNNHPIGTIPEVVVDDIEPKPVDEVDDNIMSQDLSESLIKLREESSELMEKIELFTNERREVLDKMEHLTTENRTFSDQIQQLTVERDELLTEKRSLSEERESLSEKLTKIEEEKIELIKQISETTAVRREITDELNETIKESDDLESIDRYTKSIETLQSELDNYRKAKEKGSRLASSKKLAKESTNLAEQMKILLAEHEDVRRQLKQLQQEVDNTRVVRELTPTDDDLKQLRDDVSRYRNLEIDLRAEIDRYTNQLQEKDILIQKLAGSEEYVTTNTDYDIKTLKSENDRLNDKLKIFEHNLSMQSDALEQKNQELIQLRLEFTGRHDTSIREIEILKALVAEQKEQLIASYAEHEIDVDQRESKLIEYENQIQKMTKELTQTKQQMLSANDQYVKELQEKIEALQQIFEENNEMLDNQTGELRNRQATIDQLNNQIMELYRMIEEKDVGYRCKTDEINRLTDQLSEQNKKLSEQEERNDRLESTVEQYIVEIGELKEQKTDDKRVKELENSIIEWETKNKEQHEKLKKFAANLKKKNQQCHELEGKLQQQSETTDRLAGEKESIVQELNVLRHETVRVTEIQQQAADRKHTEDQLNERNFELENQIKEFDQQLADKSFEIHRLNDKNNEMENRLMTLTEANDDLRKKIEKCKVMIKKREKEMKLLKERQEDEVIDHLKMENQSLLNQLTEIEAKSLIQQEQLTEFERVKVVHQTEYDEMTKLNKQDRKEIERLRQQIIDMEATSLRSQEAVTGKLQENQLFIESLELDNQQLRDKIARLEEGIGYIEERRSSLERQTSLLGSQLEERTTEYEHNEDELMRRLNALSIHDEIVEQKLRETEIQKQELIDNITEISNEKKELKRKVHALEHQIIESNQIDKLTELEKEIQTMMEQRTIIEQDHQRQVAEWDRRLLEKNLQIDDLDGELSQYIKKCDDERRSMLESLEKSRDEVSDLKDEIVRLKEQVTGLEQAKSDLERQMTWIQMQNDTMSQDQIEVQDLRMQIVHQQTEIDNLKAQSQLLSQNHDSEMNSLRQQITELDTLRMQVGQNQTDDQVFIQNENERLQSLLASKETEIQNYQRQALQQQMVTDPFTVPDPERTILSLRDRLVELERSLHHAVQENQQKTTIIQELERQIQPSIEMMIQPQQTFPLFEMGTTEPDESHQVQTIEHLQQNVSDLEKYVADIEQKLQQKIQEVNDLNGQLNVYRERESVETIQRVPDIVPVVSDQTIPSFDSSAFFAPVATPSLFDEAISLPINQPEEEDEYAGCVPVVEEVIVPKKAYVCQPDDQKPDGWEWSAEEALLEEQHQQTFLPRQSSLIVDDQMNQQIRVQELEDRIRDLEQERTILQEDLQKTKQQSMKMMRKLKDYKSKFDESKRSGSVDSNQLDLAIQDELNNQMRQLENRFDDLKSDYDKERTEKQSLLNRVDTLTAANDRLVEMKERQDNEITQCRRQCKELQTKLNQLEEWSDENYLKTTPEKRSTDQPSTEELNELRRQVNDVQVDNDELQSLLEDQKQQNDLLEKRYLDERKHTAILEERIKDIQTSLIRYTVEAESMDANQSKLNEKDEEIERLRAELSTNEQEHQRLNAQITDLIRTIDCLSEESARISLHLTQIRNDHSEKIHENEHLSTELKSLAARNDELSKKIDEMTTLHLEEATTKSTVNNEIIELEQRCQELMAAQQYKDMEISHLNKKIEDCVRDDQTQQLIEEILKKNKEMQELRNLIEQMRQEKLDLVHRIDEMTIVPVPTVDLTEQIRVLLDEKQQMEVELQALNDQVIANLSVQDRMKAIVVEMDMKNIEIAELKSSVQQLKQSDENPMVKENYDRQIDELNIQWNGVIEQRCAELAEQWRQHLAEREEQFSAIEIELREQLELAKSTQSNVPQPVTIVRSNRPPMVSQPSTTSNSSDSCSSTSEKDDLIHKMQQALESQELEIVTLREQLAVRSAEYARIAARIDPFGQLSTSSNNKPSPDVKTVIRKSPGESADNRKTELDLALYMLHQRDMRCEELTEELIRMLEERDMLQMKLSTAIRQIEDTKQTANIEPDSEGTTTIESPAKIDEKLSQIQEGASQSRQRVLREDRAKRQRQMALLQRDIEHMPAEAVAEIIGSDPTEYLQSTESHDSSPSSALFSWLWGRSSNNSTSLGT